MPDRAIRDAPGRAAATRLEGYAAATRGLAVQATEGGAFVTLRPRCIDAYHSVRTLARRADADAGMVRVWREAFQVPPPWNARHDGKMTSLLTLIATRAKSDPGAADALDQLVRGLPGVSRWSDPIELRVDVDLFARLIPGPQPTERQIAIGLRRADDVSTLVGKLLDLEPANRVRDGKVRWEGLSMPRPGPHHPEGLYLAVAYRWIDQKYFTIHVHHDGPIGPPGEVIHTLGEDFGYALDRTLLWRDFGRNRADRRTCIVPRAWLERAVAKAPPRTRDHERYRHTLELLDLKRNLYSDRVEEGSAVAVLWHKKMPIWSTQIAPDRVSHDAKAAMGDEWHRKGAGFAAREIDEALALRKELFARVPKRKKSCANFMKALEAERTAAKAARKSAHKDKPRPRDPLRLEPHEWVRQGW